MMRSDANRRASANRWRGTMQMALLFVLVSSFLTTANAQALSVVGASSCSGCHGKGASLPPLNGRPATEIASAMKEYRAGSRSGTIMGRLAKGFNDAEIDAIAAWLSQH